MVSFETLHHICSQLERINALLDAIAPKVDINIEDVDRALKEAREGGEET